MKKEWYIFALLALVIILGFTAKDYKDKYEAKKKDENYLFQLMSRELEMGGINGAYTDLNQITMGLEKEMLSPKDLEKALIDTSSRMQKAEMAAFALANTRWAATYEHNMNSVEISDFLGFMSWRIKHISVSDNYDAKVDAVYELKDIFLTMNNNLDIEKMYSGEYPKVINSWTAMMKKLYQEHGESQIISAYFAENAQYTK
ncbi:hypothetical protein M3231_10555 [Neobacillus mesonae]|nr:hypothetical protein [Neobacillus mesonae]